MKKIAIILLTLCFQQIMAQEGPSHIGTGFRGAYIGAISYPGFKIGIESPYKVKQTDRIKKKGTRSTYVERYVLLNLGMYHHKTFHTNYYLMAEWQMRIQFGRGFYIEYSPALGGSRTFLAGKTYEVDNDGNITDVPYSGYYYAAAGFGGGGGYNFGLKRKSPFKIYLRSNLIVLYPYNSFIYPRHTLEAGLVYTPGRLLKPDIKIKTVVK